MRILTDDVQSITLFIRAQPWVHVTEGTARNYQGERRDERGRLVPLGRVGEPADIADVIAFLCSDDARYVNGQVIYVDGGVTAGRASL